MASLARTGLGVAAVLLLSACGAIGSARKGTSTPPATAIATVLAPNGASSGCQVVEAPPTPASSGALFDVKADDHSLGPAGASVTMLFYCDLQSPQCEIFSRVADQLIKDHVDDLRLVFRPYPVPESAVSSLDKSELSARAVFAADNQGKFWEMRDLLHSQYQEWVSLSKGDFKAWVVEEARTIVGDPTRFSLDFNDPATAARAENSYEAAVALGISSIPTVFINGQLQARPALSYTGLDATIGLIALGARQFRTCPAFDIDPTRKYTATLHTEKGEIVIGLDPTIAPVAVNSFVFLAKHGWYDGSSFHRVIPGFLAQAGDPSGTGQGGPGYYFRNEIRTDVLFDRPGVVGMANSGPDTNGSQFFITFAPQPQLDGTYTIFGHVLKGMDVVESLTARDSLTTANPAPGDKIQRVTVDFQ